MEQNRLSNHSVLNHGDGQKKSAAALVNFFKQQTLHCYQCQTTAFYYKRLSTSGHSVITTNLKEAIVISKRKKILRNQCEQKRKKCEGLSMSLAAFKPKPLFCSLSLSSTFRYKILKARSKGHWSHPFVFTPLFSPESDCYFQLTVEPLYLCHSFQRTLSVNMLAIAKMTKIF